MGGYGSGRWCWHTKKDVVEDCRVLEVEADVVPLRSRDLVIEFFELLPDDLHLLPPKVFMPVDGRLGSARAFSAEIT
jgi:hypothetical protein